MESAVFFDYGQAAAPRELEAARFYASRRGVPLRIVSLPWVGTHALSSPSREGRAPEPFTPESAKAVWVPARNLVFLSIAASLAEAEGLDSVMLGINREEGVTFPDNSREFLSAANRVLEVATLRKLTLVAPLIEMDKPQMVRLLLDRGVPLDRIWSCYGGGPQACGECESCLRLGRAVRAAGA